MIGERFNMEDVFFRDLTLCVLDTLEGEINWVNKFSSGDIKVSVPFYYSLTGDDRFLLDSFSDDVVSDSRFVELNTDKIPRGHLTLTSFDIRSDEFANPNIWLRMVIEKDDEIRKMLTKVRAVPVTVKYNLTILLASEIDVFKCSQAIMDTLWIYRFMYFEHNFMNIDAVMMIPDTNQVDIIREKNLTSDNSIKLTVAFDVQTYYPAYRKDPDPIIYPKGTRWYLQMKSNARSNKSNTPRTDDSKLIKKYDDFSYSSGDENTEKEISDEEEEKNLSMNAKRDRKIKLKKK